MIIRTLRANLHKNFVKFSLGIPFFLIFVGIKQIIMKTIRIAYLVLLISITAFGQKSEFQVLNEQKILGKNLISGSDIKGQEFVFPDRIHEFFMDATTNLLTVQLRGLSKNRKWLNNTGNILQYDIKNEKLLWSKKMAYQTSKLQQVSKTMIYTVGNKSYCLDVNTGNNLWETKNNIYFLDPINNVGIGYKYRSLKGLTNELEGIDLFSGDIIWNMELNREYGWNDAFHINDSTLIVVAAGLHAININTGGGWDYTATTAEKDYSGMVAANVAGLALGILTGTFVVTTGYDLVRDLVSNTLIDDEFIYFASKEEIVKIDKQSGDIVWEHSLPKGMASKSSLLMDDRVVYMINNGYAFAGNSQVNFGKVFIAAFDRQTGKQKYLSLIDVKNDPVLSSQLSDNTIYLIHKNKIVKFNEETGEITEKIFPKNNFGELKYFVGDQVFFTNQNDDLLCLSQSDPTKIHVVTDQNKIISLDNQLNITNTFTHEDLSNNYLRTKDYSFFSKGGKTLIINNKKEKVAEIEMDSHAFIINGILYNKRDKSFVAIDLKEILP